MIIDAIIKEISSSIKDCEFEIINSRTIRLNVSYSQRTEKTKEILELFNSSTTNHKRPNDVLLPSGIKILVKPHKKKKIDMYYGNLQKINLKKFKLKSFFGISNEFSLGKLIKNVKEQSDAIAVSEINREIEKNTTSPLGINLSVGDYKFKNVLGCVPVTNGEPKADVVFVCLDEQTGMLFPDCFISYKKGKRATDFQNYSGISEKYSKFLFNHRETINFYNTLYSLNQSNIKEDVFQEIKDKKIIGLSIWGSDFGTSRYNINNCHVIAQGKAKIVGSVLDFDHIQKNGDFNFDKSYSPVFGARYATGRSNKGPKGLKVDNFRIGIFPRAYRARWLK